MSRASAGGAGGARGVGLQDLVFAWACSYLLAEQPLPGLGLPGRVVQVGAQTGLPVDDVGVRTDQDAYALYQVKAELQLGKTESSPLAEAVQQLVTQYLTGRLPVVGAPERPVRANHDVLVLCTDAAAPKTVRSDLRVAVERTGGQPPGTTFDHNLTADQRSALKVLLGHVSRCWTGAGRPAPTDEELRGLLAMLRVVVIDARPGGPEHAAALATVGTVVPTGSSINAWDRLVIEAHKASESRTWPTRPQIASALHEVGATLSPAARYGSDLAVLRDRSTSNLQALGRLTVLPIGKGLRLQRRATPELVAAVRDAGLLLLGAPGAGKTALAVHLVRELQKQQDVLLLTAADVAGTNRLTLAQPLVDSLAAWTGPPGVLVIDGLDALRGSEDRASLVSVVTGLAGSRWRVVATVRTFDARHHAALREAFDGSPVDAQASPPDAALHRVRHLLVEDLTDAELAPALAAAPALDSFLAEADLELKALLRNPFNLRLAARLIEDGVAGRTRLPAARSQLDVLDAYWEQRVRNQEITARNALLTRLCQHMLSTRVLRTREQEPIVTSSDAPALEGLLTENVLSAEASPGMSGQRILAFSHNILFDYAAAQYVLLDRSDPAGALVRELDADPSLPLIARPSLDMLLDHLWEYQRSAFWQVCLALAGSSHLIGALSVAVRLLSLVADPHDLSPLGPLIAGPTPPDRVGAAQALTSHLVGALRAAPLSPEQLHHAAESVAQLALHPARGAGTSGDFTSAALAADLLTALQARLPLDSQAAAAGPRAEAIAALLDACRRQPEDLEGIAGSAARQLADAVAVDPISTGEALARLLQDRPALLQWGGTILVDLPAVVSAVLPHDQDLARWIAALIWGFDEQRDEDVPLVSGALLSLRETRGQQAEHAVWRLGEHFHEVCAADLIGAVQIFCDMAASGLMPSNTTATAPDDWPVTAGGATGWLRYGHDLQISAGYGATANIAQAVAAALVRRVRTGGDPEPAVTTLVQELHNAAAWAALLGGDDDHEALGRAVLPALASGALLAHFDTHESAGRLLAALAHADEPPPATELEATVASAARIADIQQMSPRLLDELLGCLPAEMLSRAELADRRAELDADGGPPTLTPRFVITGSVTPRSQVDDLLDRGLQLPTGTGDAMRRLQTEVASGRDTPNELPEAFLQADAELAGSDRPEPRLRADLVQSAAQLAGDYRVLPDTSVGQRVVALLREAAGDNEVGHFHAGPTVAWTPGLVDTGVGGLVLLLARPQWASSEHAPSIRQSVRDLLDHPEPLVRMRAATGLRALHRDLDSAGRMNLASARLQTETHGVVQATLLGELVRDAAADPGAADEALRHLAHHPAGAALAPAASEPLEDPLSPLVAFLAIEVPDGFASGLVTAWFQDPLEQVENVTGAAHWLRYHGYLNLPDGHGQQAAFTLLHSAATVAAARWVENASLRTSTSTSILTAAARVAGGIAQQVCFASGAFKPQPTAGVEDPGPRGDPGVFAGLATPVLQQCAAITEPKCTHSVVQTLIHLAPTAERQTLLLIADTVPADGPYHRDTLASGEVVPYLQRLVVEHPEVVLGDTMALTAFRHLLQTFAGAGHPEALALAYGFADIFR